VRPEVDPFAVDASVVAIGRTNEDHHRVGCRLDDRRAPSFGPGGAARSDRLDKMIPSMRNESNEPVGMGQGDPEPQEETPWKR
jgi:hypothetical protein